MWMCGRLLTDRQLVRVQRGPPNILCNANLAPHLRGFFIAVRKVVY